MKKRPLRFRPAVERLEDRWCPTYTYNGLTPSFPGPNPVGGAMSIVDTDTAPNLSILYQGSGQWQITDNGTGGPTTATFTGVTNLEVTLGGTTDTLDINLGGLTDVDGFISVALDGTAQLTTNTFTFENGFLTNSSNNNTLFVLGQGGNNSVTLGDGGTTTTQAGRTDILFRDAANGPNPTTLNNGTNTTLISYYFTSNLAYNSQSTNATGDMITLGTAGGGFSAGGFWDSGSADINFKTSGGANTNNNYTLVMNHGGVSRSLSGGHLNIFGGGSGASVTLGNGTDAVSVDGTNSSTVIDLDNTSGGTVTVNANVNLRGTTRFDDFATVSVAGGVTGATFGKGLTIWNSDAGSTVTLGGNITGDVTFASGSISGDTDDAGSGSGATDSVTLLAGAKLTGNLTANLRTSSDTIDIEGNLTKALIVNGHDGNVTVMEGTTGIIGQSATIHLGGNGVKTLSIDGLVHSGASSATNLTVDSAAGAIVDAELGESSTVNGSVSMNLSQSSANEVEWEAGGVITGHLTLVANGGGALFNNFDPGGHPSAKYTLFGAWTVGSIPDDPD